MSGGNGLVVERAPKQASARKGGGKPPHSRTARNKLKARSATTRSFARRDLAHFDGRTGRWLRETKTHDGAGTACRAPTLCD